MEKRRGPYYSRTHFPEVGKIKMVIQAGFLARMTCQKTTGGAEHEEVLLAFFAATVRGPYRRSMWQARFSTAQGGMCPIYRRSRKCRR
jgi:hypothetical protein